MTTLSQELKACIDGITAANVCLAEHVGEAAMARCLTFRLDCTGLCAAYVQMMAGDSDYVTRVCGVRADLCSVCADDCGKLDSKACEASSEACRRCAEQGRQMAA